MTPLEKTLRRSLQIDGIDYVVTLSPEALKITRKGHRLGMELKWADLTSGDSALAVALNASVGKFAQAATRQPETTRQSGPTRQQEVTRQPGVARKSAVSRKSGITRK